MSAARGAALCEALQAVEGGGTRRLLGPFPVPPEHGALVADLGGDESGGNAARGPLVPGDAILRRPGAGGGRAGPDDMAEQPAAGGMPGHRDLPAHQLVQRRSGDRDWPVDGEFGDLDERGRGRAVVGLDGQRFAGLAHAGARCLDVERQGGVVCGIEHTRGLALAEEVDLVGQADAGERTARTLGRVLERRWPAASGGGEAQLGDRPLGPVAELGVQDDADALAALDIPERTLLDPVAGILQDHGLKGDLDALGLVGALVDMRALAALVVDRRDLALLPFDDVHPGDGAEAFGGERDGARYEEWRRVVRLRAGRVWGGEPSRGAVDAGMRAPAVGGVTGLGPLPLDPHQIGEPWAVDPLVDHPRRNQCRLARRGRRGQRKLWLSLRHRQSVRVKRPPPSIAVRPRRRGPDTGCGNVKPR